MPVFGPSKQLGTISLPSMLLSRNGTLEVSLSNVAETQKLVKELRAR